jgi:hypothetical protein
MAPSGTLRVEAFGVSSLDNSYARQATPGDKQCQTLHCHPSVLAVPCLHVV